jgi:hypothetical protein
LQKELTQEVAAKIAGGARKKGAAPEGGASGWSDIRGQHGIHLEDGRGLPLKQGYPLAPRPLRTPCIVTKGASDC